MTVSWIAALLTGLVGVFGVLGGSLLTGTLNSRIEKHKRADEDERRWIADRRRLYSRYTMMCESMLRDIDHIGVFLGYDEQHNLSEEDDALIREDLPEYFAKWDDELQPLLEELQLISSTEVADLSDRISGALMEVTAPIEKREAFVEYYPVWFQAKDLLTVLRNAMRAELGVGALPDGSLVRREEDWPWLPARPSAEHYRQRHRAMDTAPGASPSVSPGARPAEDAEIPNGNEE